jgi:hypothetical protein
MDDEGGGGEEDDEEGLEILMKKGMRMKVKMKLIMKGKKERRMKEMTNRTLWVLTIGKFFFLHSLGVSCNLFLPSCAQSPYS